MSVVIGWDIGGAHLKAARVSHGRVEAVVQAATPLWLGLGSLETALDALRAELGPADRHAVTMTGELCDAFPSRREGVAGLAAIAADHLAPAAPSLYAGRAGFVELGEAGAHAADIASANWHASAALVGLKLRDALFIDIGSTTTDIIPVAAGEVAAIGYSDAERLASGELIYTGMTRSFVMALASQAPFRGAWTPLMNEYFANSADVHRVLHRLPDGADKMATADGREKSLEASRSRLARMIGREGDEGAALGVGWACGLVRGSANTPDRRRRLAASVPQRCRGRGAGGRGRRRGKPRRGSRAPSEAALYRIFFADRGPGGGLALRAGGRGRMARGGTGQRRGRLREWIHALDERSIISGRRHLSRERG